jgi:hypothetical protein
MVLTADPPLKSVKDCAPGAGPFLNRGVLGIRQVPDVRGYLE